MTLQVLIEFYHEPLDWHRIEICVLNENIIKDKHQLPF